MDRYFDSIEMGDEELFGAYELTPEDVQEFHARFAPPLPGLSASDAPSNRAGRIMAAQAHIYAAWSRMLYEHTKDWPVLARIGQDQVRWYKTAYAEDVLHVRMTIVSKEPLSADRGVLISQHEVLNQDRELVLSLFTRAVLACRSADEAAA